MSWKAELIRGGRAIRYYRLLHDKRCLFVESMRKLDKSTEAALMRLIKKTSEIGLWNPTFARKERDPIWRLWPGRSCKARLYFFFAPGRKKGEMRIVITHAAKKMKQRADPNEIERAIRGYVGFMQDGKVFID